MCAYRAETLVSHRLVTQGAVLSPFLFTRYNPDFSFWSELCHLQKFSEHSALVECISRGEESESRAVINYFVTWCEVRQLNCKTPHFETTVQHIHSLMKYSDSEERT